MENQKEAEKDEKRRRIKEEGKEGNLVLTEYLHTSFISRLHLTSRTSKVPNTCPKELKTNWSAAFPLGIWPLPADQAPDTDWRNPSQPPLRKTERRGIAFQKQCSIFINGRDRKQLTSNCFQSIPILFHLDLLRLNNISMGVGGGEGRRRGWGGVGGGGADCSSRRQIKEATTAETKPRSIYNDFYHGLTDSITVKENWANIAYSQTHLPNHNTTVVWCRYIRQHHVVWCRHIRPRSCPSLPQCSKGF